MAKHAYKIQRRGRTNTFTLVNDSVSAKCQILAPPFRDLPILWVEILICENQNWRKRILRER